MRIQRSGEGVVVEFLAAFLTALLVVGQPDGAAAGADRSPLRMVVMDPLSDRLACDCVAGYAQRKYDQLGRFLSQRLGRPVQIAYAESLALPQAQTQRGVDLVIGKFSEVRFDAARVKLNVRTVAMLTGQDGTVTQAGLFVVRQADPAQSIEDLEGYSVLMGPEDALEKHSAALSSLEAFGLPIPEQVPTAPSCSDGALAVVEQEAGAAVISSYAKPLLEGCGTIDPGALRVVGTTDPVPFIGVFATDRVDAALEDELLERLLEVGRHPALCAALESRDGFVALPDPGVGAKRGRGWPDWRGPNRDAISSDVPETLPAEKRLLWSRTLTGPGMSGLAVGPRCVIVADKALDQAHDVFRCLDADTGRQRWKLAYTAAGKMDFTNSPRANPVIRDELVYLLGALGDLHCVNLRSGQVVWRRHLVDDFGAKLPTWGTCSTPLVVDDKLIVNPGTEEASIVALDRFTGAVLWQAPGDPAGYASFVLAELGGVRQIVGYDAVSLGGWAPRSGKRLWRLVPEWDGDFNVPTPVVVGRRLLVSTENNGTRLYAFDRQGRILPEPVASSDDLAPDTSTPVVLDGMVFGNFGALVCLDLDDGLKTLWEADDDSLADYCSLVAGRGRVLVMTQTGALHLVRADKKRFECISTLQLFADLPDADRETWSHPALVGNRLYVRNLLGVYCFLLQ
jgi:outer membrane protein assembly factor BamB